MAPPMPPTPRKICLSLSDLLCVCAPFGMLFRVFFSGLLFGSPPGAQKWAPGLKNDPQGPKSDPPDPQNHEMNGKPFVLQYFCDFVRWNIFWDFVEVIGRNSLSLCLEFVPSLSLSLSVPQWSWNQTSKFSITMNSINILILVNRTSPHAFVQI